VGNDDQWVRFCRVTGVAAVERFATNRQRVTNYNDLKPALDALLENGEFKNKAISDAEKASITATTKGNIINVSRQMIVNDDMGAFTKLMAMLGRAAGLSVEVDVYALLALNSGLGPDQSDGQPLFHANRSNVGSGAAISVVSLDADRVVMAIQKDPWGNEYLDLRPAVLLVPVALGGTARVINTSTYDPDTASKLQRPNMVQGLFRDIVDTPRITSPRRYLFADPSVAPVLEVAFLEGQASPVLETQDGWRTDGAEMKVRFDYGVAAVDYRGAVTNAGQ
ncbi:MAG: Clp protease ClpP, partial [Verrucomicrobiota bacterium]